MYDKYIFIFLVSISTAILLASCQARIGISNDASKEYELQSVEKVGSDTVITWVNNKNIYTEKIHQEEMKSICTMYQGNN